MELLTPGFSSLEEHERTGTSLEKRDGVELPATLPAPRRIDQRASRAPSSDIVSRWTNADVILWALNADLKSQIPALIQHELTGGALQQLSDREEIRKALCVQATEVKDEFVLSAFELRLGHGGVHDKAGRFLEGQA